MVETDEGREPALASLAAAGNHHLVGILRLGRVLGKSLTTEKIGGANEEMVDGQAAYVDRPSEAHRPDRPFHAEPDYAARRFAGPSSAMSFSKQSAAGRR